MATSSSEKSITFRNLSVAPTRIEVEATTPQDSHVLWFSYDRSMHVSEDAVAAALSTLCGTKFDQIHFDFGVSPQLLEGIAGFTRASVTSNEKTAATDFRGSNITLSFSGGFDSLAAYRLLGDEAQLVSLDFGGWFEREAHFFKRFDPLVVSTNARSTPSQQQSFARNHWTFMAIGAILSAEHLETGFHVFGSILGEKFSRPAVAAKVPPLDMLGIPTVPVTDGISELGTAKILVQTDASMLTASIDSLAGAKDRKRFLKILLARTMADELGVELSLPSVPKTWNQKIGFTSSYTTALTALYLISRGKADAIAPLYESIPRSAFEITDGLKMDFMTKVNTDFYQAVPPTLGGLLTENLLRLGFAAYSEEDWVEAKLVRSYLNRLFGV